MKTTTRYLPKTASKARNLVIIDHQLTQIANLMAVQVDLFHEPSNKERDLLLMVSNNLETVINQLSQL